MPVEVQTLDRGLGLCFLASGIVKVEEVLRSQEVPLELLTPARYVLVDFTLVELLDITGHDIRRIVNNDKRNVELRPDLVQAMLAPADLPFGLGRIYAALSEREGWATEIFRDRAAAEGWLRKQVSSDLTFDPDHPPSDVWL